MTKMICFLFLTSFSTFSFAQVANDNIEKRQFLQLEEIYNSKTDECTVQWECVDESLTGKCIEYHNDQWFFFNSGDKRKLYINIINQECRDLKGVQIVVLTGDPCNIPTYDVLTCVSLATQDDIYVVLDSLKPHQNYLINIDGYLHDYCAFQIQISTKAKGLPLQESIKLNAKSNKSGKMIQIDWDLPDSLRFNIQEFQIFRRIHPEFKSGLMQVIPVVANAYGEFPIQYSFRDSVELKKTYYYQIACLGTDSKLHLIDKFQFYLSNDPALEKFKKQIIIPLGKIRKKTSVTVIVYDYYSMRVLFHKQFNYKRNNPGYYNFYTWSLINDGIDKLIVEVINSKSHNREKHFYNLQLEDH